MTQTINRQKSELPTLVFATNNAHKLEELRQLTAGRYTILSLADINCNEDIPETADTIEGNARMKAEYVTSHYGYDCFADDTGLMVEALGGEPGVYSARYASADGHDSKANMRKLLTKLDGVTDRRAHFLTVIALTSAGEPTRCFEGRVDGTITTTPAGDSGFGYDPVFLPEGEILTFAQMDSAAKNAISHRGRAVTRLMEYLNN